MSEIDYKKKGSLGLCPRLFLFSGGKIITELQSPRYIVISFLIREMEVDIVEVITIMAELENSGLVQGIKWRFNTQRTWKSAQNPLI